MARNSLLRADGPLRNYSLTGVYANGNKYDMSKQQDVIYRQRLSQMNAMITIH